MNSDIQYEVKSAWEQAISSLDSYYGPYQFSATLKYSLKEEMRRRMESHLRRVAARHPT